MEEKSFWESLSAEELIEQMYARTDSDGTLYMESFFHTDTDVEEKSLRCKLHWGVDGCEKVLNEYRRGGNFDAGSCTRGLYTRGVE